MAQDAVALDALIRGIAFDADGLVPALAQQHDSGEVLMLAWMNAEAVAETVRTGRVCYWSRSRRRLWHKGETSGQIQRLVELRIEHVNGRNGCPGDLRVLEREVPEPTHTEHGDEV